MDTSSWRGVRGSLRKKSWIYIALFRCKFKLSKDFKDLAPKKTEFFGNHAEIFNYISAREL